MARTLDQIEADERAKYDAQWRKPGYRKRCHGLELWTMHKDNPDVVPKLETGERVLDIGCGTGRLMAEWMRLGFDAWGVDISELCLDDEVAKLYPFRLVVAPLWHLRPLPDGFGFKFGICADVMEHIPTDQVPDVLEALWLSCETTLFSIANFPDRASTETGGEITLHLTLKPAEWWLEQMTTVAPGSRAGHLRHAARFGRQEHIIKWEA